MTVPGPPPPPPPPPPGPQPRPPATSQQKGIRLRPAFIVGMVFLLVVVGAVVGIVTIFASGKAVAAEVTKEPISTAGANPFMPAVGTDQPDVKPPPSTSGSFPANTPGLYGGTLNKASCDPAAMVAFLQANPDKAAAWAGAQGIDVSAIPSYVAELTPVILRTDTWVTNHGFSGGKANPITSVLQAGTAVLVDKFGQPRVKCYCGNPLKPVVVPSSPTFLGPSWSGFSETNITIIQETTVVINTFTLVDPATNQVIERPAGSTGAADKPVAGLPSSTTAPTPTIAPPPAQARTSSGSHTLVQRDAPNCSFSDAPQINGTITMTVQPNGAVSGTMRGNGSGSRPISCNGTTATMNWSQDYSVTFSGRVVNGQLTASGSLNNTNRTTLTNCSTGGQPSTCPFYQGGAATLPISLTGSYDQGSGQGSGSFTVQVERPTSGTWNVR